MRLVRAVLLATCVLPLAAVPVRAQGISVTAHVTLPVALTRLHADLSTVTVRCMPGAPTGVSAPPLTSVSLPVVGGAVQDTARFDIRWSGILPRHVGMGARVGCWLEGWLAPNAAPAQGTDHRMGPSAADLRLRTTAAVDTTFTVTFAPAS
jgi:hypothetical protein